MPRDIPIGNGTMLAAFDFDYRLRDFYYPRVGKENHALGYPWRFGVWLDGEFSWLDRRSWTLSLDYVADALVTEVAATHARLPLRLAFRDAIDYEKNILIRQVTVHNLSARPLSPRLFFHADLNALENENGDTVFFDPKNAGLIHYKGPRYFLMSCATASTLGVTHFSTGTKRHHGLEGAWRDAEDGDLAGNPISQGSVDSVIGMHLELPPKGHSVCHYWMAVGDRYSEVEALHLSGRTDEARRLIKLGVQDAAAYARPFVLSPGTPKERVELLRKAFQDTLKDKAFLAEADKAGLMLDPLSGEELAKMVVDLGTLDSAFLAKLKGILYD